MQTAQVRNSVGIGVVCRETASELGSRRYDTARTFLLCVTLCLFVCLSTLPAHAGSTGSTTGTAGVTRLFTFQGATSDSSEGDAVTTAGSSYSIYIEVPPGLASFTLELFDADTTAGPAGAEAGQGRDQARANTIGPNADTTCSYSLTSPLGLGTLLLTAAPGTNTCPAGGALENAWCPFVQAPATAGHWQLTISCPTGNDANAVGVRAHDGTVGSGGTELNVYYDSYGAYGRNRNNPVRPYTHFPWVTRNCAATSNSFDADDEGVIGGVGADFSLTSRTGAFTNNHVGSSDNVWSNASLTSFTSRDAAADYGIWTLGMTVRLRSNSDDRNYLTYSLTDADPSPPGPGPTSFSQPDPNAYRVYLSTDAIHDVGGVPTAPAKPYVEQYISHVGGGGNVGPNPPVVGRASAFAVTVTVRNPTSRAITFSEPNHLVRSLIPASGLVSFQSIAGTTPGVTIVSAPSFGGTGFLTWNPGTVAAGGFASVVYSLSITPSTSPQTIPVTGTAGATFSGLEAGTVATWVDETGNTAQPRATYTFGPLCAVATSTETLTYVLLAGAEVLVTDDRVVLEWQTAAEVGTVGFDVERADRASGKPLRLNRQLLPAEVAAPQGAIYRWVDPDASPADPPAYFIVEHDRDGRRQRYGPFEPKPAGEKLATLPVAGFSSEPRRADLELLPAARLALASSEPPVLEAAAPLGFKIGVRETGLYRVDAAALFGSGRPPFAVDRAGTKIAWLPGETNGSLYFYAEAIDSPYTRDNVYWLQQKQGTRMTKENAAPSTPGDPAASFESTLHFESDAFAATAISPDPESDYWFWRALRAGTSAANQSFTLEVPDPAATAGLARLRLGLRGATTTEVAGEHRVEVRVNGTLIGEVSWQGLSPYTAELAFDPALLLAGSNQLQLLALATPGVTVTTFYADAFDLDYARRLRAVGDGLRFAPEGLTTAVVGGFSSPQVRLLRITNPAKPVLVEGAVIEGTAGDYRLRFDPRGPGEVYFAVGTGAIRTPVSAVAGTPMPNLGAGADYLVIAPSSLLEAADRLAGYRASRGHAAAAVSLEALYDHYRHGLPNPNAIRDFLTEAAGWPRAARYVALAGEGHFDYRNLLGAGGNLLPPLMVQTRDGLFSSDLRFGDVTGNDGVPEIAVGRLSVLTAAELDVYVEKLIAYEKRTPVVGEKLLLLADNPDAGGDFTQASQALEALLPAGHASQRLTLEGSTAASVRTELFAALAEGANVFAYSGHGGVDRLAQEALLAVADVPALAGLETLPVVTALTCTIGRFEIPSFPSLAEELVRRPGGAIAVWAPSGLAVNQRSTLLGDRLIRAVYQNGERVLGEAVLTALAQTALVVNEPFAVYNLFGDPALTLEIPPPAASPSPPETGGAG